MSCAVPFRVQIRYIGCVLAVVSLLNALCLVAAENVFQLCKTMVYLIRLGPLSRSGRVVRRTDVVEEANGQPAKRRDKVNKVSNSYLRKKPKPHPNTTSNTTVNQNTIWKETVIS